jgi:signal transduction histidine kinase
LEAKVVPTAKILAVDDEPGVRYFIEETLASGGYEVVTADCGETALGLITNQEFDVALLDLKMNGMDGLEVLATLRQRSPNTVAIVLTGHGSMETAVEALRQGAHDYLLKPCDPEKLRESVRAGLEQHWRNLQQTAEAKFVTHASHQLRNPLASIDLHAYLLEHGLPDKRTYHLDMIKQEIKEMKNLVEGILILSRLEASEVEHQFTRENLNTLIEWVVNARQADTKAAGLELIFEPDADLPPVLVERNQVMQMVANLVTNAINYTSSGLVRVSTHHSAERGQVCLKVQDTGMGIDSHDLPHLFKRFYRGPRAVESGISGTGLGLAIVKEIVDLHKGDLEVESQVGEGSTFKVWLPIDG